MILRLAALAGTAIIQPPSLSGAEVRDASSPIVDGTTAPAEAPASTSVTRVLSEEEAVALAVDRSSELAALNLAVRAQEQRTSALFGGLNNPELRIQELSTKYARDNEENRQLQAGVRWRPPRPGELGRREQEDIVDLWRKKVRAEAFRQTLIADVRRAYVQVVLLPELVELAEQQVTVLEKEVSALSELAAIGQRPALAGIKGQARLLRAHAEASVTRQQLADASARLSARVGENVTVVRSPPPSAEVEPVELGALHTLAMQRRLVIHLSDQEATLVDRQYSSAVLGMVPWPTFIEIIYHAERARPDWGELQIGFDLPLITAGTGELSATRVARDGAARTREAAAEAIDREIRDALTQYREAVAQWRTLSSGAEAFLAKSVGLLQAANSHQVLPVEDVLDLELAQLEARQSALWARLRLAEGAIELCRAVGDPRCLQSAR